MLSDFGIVFDENAEVNAVIVGVLFVFSRVDLSACIEVEILDEMLYIVAKVVGASATDSNIIEATNEVGQVTLGVCQNLGVSVGHDNLFAVLVMLNHDGIRATATT